MRKFFLISLMTLCTCVMAFADGHATYQEGDVAEMKVVIGTETTTTYFATLQDAFDNLPQNSYPATVKVLANTVAAFQNRALVINQFQNVILDLNGKTVYTNGTNTKGGELILNKGTLTITDSSEGKAGLLSNEFANPDNAMAENRVPSYATSVIKNCGRVYMNGGTIECKVTTVGASYCIDMYESWENYAIAPANYVEINGGTLKNDANPCIRVCGYHGANQTLIINDGKLTSQRRGIWIQQQTKNVSKYATQNVTVTINGGEIEVGPGYDVYASRNWAIMAEADDNNDWHCLTINVNGGIIKGDIAMDASDSWDGTWPNIGKDVDKLAKVNITGGVFLKNANPDTHGSGAGHNGAFYYRMCERVDYSMPGLDEDGYQMEYPYKTITGGIFESNPNEVTNIVLDNYTNGKTMAISSTYDKTSVPMKAWGYYIADGYVAREILSGEHSGKWEVVPAAQVIVNDNTEWTDATNYSATDVTVENGAEVVIPQDQTVEVHALDVKGEGQIVVEDGATLIIGNGGLVSTNNTMTQIVVEAGGTVAIGNGGITQLGAATPIEIHSDGNKSGVLLIDPNAPAAVAKAPAKVNVYTRAYKDGEVEHWQHIASPVKGENMSIKPLNVTAEHLYTIMYGWNATAGEWELLSNLPDISGVKAFDKDGWEGDDLLTPFAAYDLINNSPSSEGGITYEFAGELCGTEDLILNFPKNGFCLFGNSYTAPIDLNTLFDKIKNDMTTSLDLAETAIDPCVYVFNSEANRFESVNSLDLLLNAWGLPAAFTQIPPQQAFVMNLLKGNSGQSSISYATSVWGNPNANKNTPIMAPKHQQEATFSALLNISVTDGNATDRVILVEDNKYSNEYDLGADAMKYMNGTFNLYANTAIGQLDKVATNNIENTELSFKAGNEISYTMMFNNVMGDYVLVDRANNSQVAIEEGGIYTFAAQPNYTAEARFAIVPAAKMPTAIENTEVKSNVKGIYTITGQYMGENFNVLPAGVYVIDGVKIVK